MSKLREGVTTAHISPVYLPVEECPMGICRAGGRPMGDCPIRVCHIGGHIGGHHKETNLTGHQKVQLVIGYIHAVAS